MGQLPKGRVLGVDAGTVRTGLALSDTDGFLASVLCTVKANGIRALAAEIKNKAEEHNVRLIVIGHPINMNGTLGESSARIHRLADEIRLITEIPVTLFDERCTTMVAASILNMTDTRGSKRKAVIDNLSAEIILQNYLDSERRKI
jgi:putative Holliday junction resolvase